jgi:hypothetical protein
MLNSFASARTPSLSPSDCQQAGQQLEFDETISEKISEASKGQAQIEV